MASRKNRQIDLDQFLAGLPEETAAKARAAAARIDELEHAAQRIGRADKTYMQLFLASGIMFIVAVWMLISSDGMFAGGQPHLIDVTVLLMAGALPTLILVYSLKMSERSRIDRQKFEIIENYFLPHNAIYLPPGPGKPAGTVAIPDSGKSWHRRLEDGNKFKKPGWYW